ncbi:MAG: hypothetical protein KKB34_14080 [Bacteroidetes bacterium]|nr:hypothetical protein [Bacteroidota bacterium]
MYRHMLTVILFFTTITIFAQTTLETAGYRNDAYGDVIYRREGIMDGNQIRTLFNNQGEVAHWPFQPSGEWPKGTGHSYLDGVAVLIASQVKAPGNNQLITPLQTAYREWTDYDKTNGLQWTLEPVPGYMNPQSVVPAINTNSTTWPEKWPRALPIVDASWDGYWYGYFGRGVQNADVETFFVMDDSKDGEWKRAPYNFFPIAADTKRGGLGLRIEVRGFQWSHVLAEDIIFWHYDIVNISDFDYPTTAFGFYTDPGVGGTNDSDDDNAFYDKTLDIAYAFDSNGKGTPGQYPTGYYGYAYLESPGLGFNGIDDDEDGLIDERRDDGIDNDGDWVPFTDLNMNGKWDPQENEPLNDDVGKDGVGPFDRQYVGPDAGEGDGKPTPGEPHFDQTDIDESDMIGLTALSIYRLGDGGTGGGWPKDDESMWVKMTSGLFDTELQKANISMVFSAAPFELKANLRERFSMALVFGADLDDLIFNKETVQEIYNANYNFSKPPEKPKLTAVAGDKKVYLYWDDLAEESRDPFMGYQIPGDPTSGPKKDFEGYLIYRSQEAEFNDIKTITDSKGQTKFWKPIAQFDLKDGIKGPDPVGVNGASFWRGNDTGLTHSFVDSNVVNGEKYYYAVVSYDMGDPARGTKGLTPSECTKIISEDFTGTLNFVDINCAVIVPNAPAAGYIPPQIEGTVSEVEAGVGTGTLEVALLNPASIIEGASYKVVFNATGAYPSYKTSEYSVVRSHSGSVDTLITVPASDIGKGKYSSPFDGMTVSALNDTAIAINMDKSGWFSWTGGDNKKPNLTMNIIPDNSSPAKNVIYPADYRIEWFDQTVATTPFFKIPINFLVINTTTQDTVEAEVFDNNADKLLSIGDDISIMERLPNKDFRLTWRITYLQPAGIGYQPIYPGEGDVFVIKTSKQFGKGDYFTFSTKASRVDAEMAKNKLDEIRVVPNPYVAQATWERRNLNQTGRGERRIDFIHLPAQCKVKIFTISGALVKTIDKESSTEDGSVSWNLVTEDGMDAAFGLYVYHVDAPGVGEHIGKFAIIK